MLDVRLVDAPAGVTQEEGHTGFLIHVFSAMLASIFLATRIQPFLFDREVLRISSRGQHSSGDIQHQGDDGQLATSR